MPFELKIALKYFRSRRKGLVRFTAITAVVGIAAGVASLIVAQAISKGFSDEIRDKVLLNTSHITIFNEGETTVSDWQIIKRKIEQIRGVVDFEPTTYESVVISSDEDSGYGVLRVKVNSAVNEHGSGIANLKNSEQIKVSIGMELAKRLEVKKGNTVDIVTLENEKTPETTTVYIESTFETGLFEYDSTWISITEANFLRLKETEKFSPKVFSVSVADIYSSDEIAGKIRKNLGEGFKVLDWQEANKPLFAALSLERKVAFAVILLITFLAILNLTTMLSLLVAERRLDVAVLRTCGAKSKSIVLIFLVEGIILSLSGIILGVVGGLLICFIGNRFKLISLSKEVYSLSSVPFNLDFFNIFMIVFAAIILSLAAILYPAIKASGIKPLENLRHQ